MMLLKKSCVSRRIRAREILIPVREQVDVRLCRPVPQAGLLGEIRGDRLRTWIDRLHAPAARAAGARASCAQLQQLASGRAIQEIRETRSQLHVRTEIDARRGVCWRPLVPELRARIGDHAWPLGCRLEAALRHPRDTAIKPSSRRGHRTAEGLLRQRHHFPRASRLVGRSARTADENLAAAGARPRQSPWETQMPHRAGAAAR